MVETGQLELEHIAFDLDELVGEVDLRVELDPAARERGSVLFSVRDIGIGIPIGKQEEIFASFVQADASTTRRHGGTGLGLAISSRIVELMGGRIRVTSQPGQGSTSTFTFSIPQKLHRRQTSGPAARRWTFTAGGFWWRTTMPPIA
jgi:signal transduction histidine kinase